MNIDLGDPVFIGDFFGFLLSVPMALALAFWMAMVKNKAAVVTGAFIGCFLGFLIILVWASNWFFVDANGKYTDLPGVNGAAAFFGAILFCSILGLVGGILTDLLVARRASRDYRRPQPVH